MGTTAVPISIRVVAAATSAAAVSASNSLGIWGIHTEAKPACSAHVASARIRSTLVAYRPRSGPTMRPIRIDPTPPPRTILLLECNGDSADANSTSASARGTVRTVTTAGSAIYYDPYDFEIDSDPYPVWRRLREEAPLYVNERYGFYALSRFDDIERASIDWKSYISSRGTVLEILKMGMEIPPGSIIFEDPPAHDIHRALLSRVFTPRKVSELEPKVREF